MPVESKNANLERVQKPKLTKRERQINMIVAAREFRRRKKAQGYKVWQCWIPDDIREDVKSIVKDLLADWEAKHPLVRQKAPTDAKV